MVDMLVRLGFGLVLCALVKGNTSIYCPLSVDDATPRFNVLCSNTNPCHNIDIYCPSNSYTDTLWMDCKGAHACVNVTIYSSVSTRVRCRSRTGACENVNYHCGDDLSSVLSSLPSSKSSLFISSNQDSSQEIKSVSCKFRHTDSYVTQKAFFGCYGGNVRECVSFASADNAYTDSRMHCGTSNTPCVMGCSTSNSCSSNKLECAAEDQSLCQCQTKSNCNGVETVDTRYVPTTSNVDSIVTTADSTEPSEPSSSATTTEVVHSSTTTVETTQTQTTQAQTTETQTTETQTTQGSQVSSSAIASTTPSASSTQSEQTSTEGTSVSETPVTTTSSVSTTEVTTVSSSETTSTSESSTTVLSTTGASTTTTTNLVSQVEDLESYHHDTKKDNSHSLKTWQLILAIVLPIVGTAIVCLVGAYIVKYHKKGRLQPIDGKDDESEPHRKSISAQSVEVISPPAVASPTEV